MQALFGGQFDPNKQFQIIHSHYWAQFGQKL